MRFSPQTTKKKHMKKIRLCFKQARNQGGQSPLKFISPPLQNVQNIV